MGLSMRWMDDASCGNWPTEIFWPDSRVPSANQLVRARGICARCPVRKDCFAYAMANPAMAGDGIWAGLSAPQRTSVRRKVCRVCRAGDPMTLWDREISSHGQTCTACDSRRPGAPRPRSAGGFGAGPVAVLEREGTPIENLAAALASARGVIQVR